MAQMTGCKMKGKKGNVGVRRVRETAYRKSAREWETGRQRDVWIVVTSAYYSSVSCLLLSSKRCRAVKCKSASVFDRKCIIHTFSYLKHRHIRKLTYLGVSPLGPSRSFSLPLSCYLMPESHQYMGDVGKVTLMENQNAASLCGKKCIWPLNTISYTVSGLDDWWLDWFVCLFLPLW